MKFLVSFYRLFQKEESLEILFLLLWSHQFLKSFPGSPSEKKFNKGPEKFSGSCQIGKGKNNRLNVCGSEFDE